MRMSARARRRVTPRSRRRTRAREWDKHGGKGDSKDDHNKDGDHKDDDHDEDDSSPAAVNHFLWWSPECSGLSHD